MDSIDEKRPNLEPVIRRTIRSRRGSWRFTIKPLEIHDQASGDYGHRPIHDHLMEEGCLCGRDRTLRLMNKLKISGQQSRAYKPQGTDSAHDFGYSPNLLRDLGETRFCDEAWVADTTYDPGNS
ncbi:MAG: putative transposase [Candidatus Pelagisphaera sp.]|jgi:putative transposase